MSLKGKAKKRPRKSVKGLIQSQEKRSHAAVTAPGGLVRAPDSVPEGMSPEELEYRKLLQEAILHVTKQVLEEQRPDILKRAEERAKVLMELRG